MKNETIASDITRTLAAIKAEIVAKATRARILSVFDSGGNPQATDAAVTVARDARLTSTEAQADIKRIPAPRRTLAASIIATAERIGMDAATMGDNYSGSTSHVVRWGEMADASTATGQGEQYSRGCTYKKTDADHIVTLDPLGVAALVENEPLRNISARDGLRLIALYPDGSAVWVKSRGKAITSERGWIVGNASVCFHSTKSLEHAQKGFEKKQAALMKELRDRRLTSKQERRARLVARLCHGIKATLADAKALGYCEPGIRAFQSRFGVGDEATLPQLVHTGDPSAVRLALKLARNLQPVNA